MTYAALTNWKYDKNLYHNIQSGPQRTGDTLDLTDTYKLVSSGFRMPDGNQQSYYTVINQGPDFGIITPGPPMTTAAELGLPNYPETQEYKVTVVPTPQGNRFALDGAVAQSLILYEGSTYIFDLSDPSMSAHPFIFSKTQDGIHAGGVPYTPGVFRQGVQGQPGAFVEIVVQPDQYFIIYPFCAIHPGMGGSAEYRLSGAPHNQQIYLTTNWRAVPPAVPGFWTDYNFWVNPQVSGELNVQDGFRYQNLFHVANAIAQTALGPQPGLRDRGAYAWFRGVAPNNQHYQPFQTPPAPAGEPPGTASPSTGGGSSYPQAQYPTITNVLGQGSESRADWKYNAPVYCETFSEIVRPKLPGALDSNIRRMYRGKSSRYVYNYGATYGAIGEAARNIIRTYSPGVNGAGNISK